MGIFYRPPCNILQKPHYKSEWGAITPLWMYRRPLTFAANKSTIAAYFQGANNLYLYVIG
jgi:hypothetical protein